MTLNTRISFPRAIVHIDGDGFFASCEQALHPDYQGKPVVTGKDRGIATSMSYEAKAKGVKRGMTRLQIQQVCPEAIFLPGNYEAYSLFSKRMFAIMRRFTPLVEEYSIDEGFADITGLRQSSGKSYQMIVKDMQDAIHKELGISVSVGLAPTKTLAKAASSWNKPKGYTIISAKKIPDFLSTLKIGDVWGIGPNTAKYMKTLEIETAYDFISRPFTFVEKKFTKPHKEIWKELSGETVYSVIPEEKQRYLSISKTHTFSSTTNAQQIFAELATNLENACTKARRFHQVAKRLVVLLKQQDFTMKTIELDLVRASAFPKDMMPLIRSGFSQLYQSDTLYRSTGVVLCDLQEDTQVQSTLFESSDEVNKTEQIYNAVDQLSEKFGVKTVKLASTLKKIKPKQTGSMSKKQTYRPPTKFSFLGLFSTRKSLSIPVLSLSVR